MTPRLPTFHLFLAGVLLAGIPTTSVAHQGSLDFPGGRADQDRWHLPEGVALLPEFALISTGIVGLPVSSSAGSALAFWHPAASAFVRPTLFYTHSIRHFPASVISVAGAKRANVDQLDADLVIYGSQGLWGGKTRFYSVAGEWGFDHQSQNLVGFPRRRVEGRLEGEASGRRILSWLAHGCSHLNARFRAFSHGVHIRNWTTSRKDCGLLIRLFPWFTIAFSDTTSRMDIPLARKRTFTTATRRIPTLAQLSFTPFFTISVISRETISGNLSALTLAMSFLCVGNYGHRPYGETLSGGGRFVAARLSLPGISLRYGEVKDVLPLLISLPWDRPENVPMPPQFRDIHMASASLPH